MIQDHARDRDAPQPVQGPDMRNRHPGPRHKTGHDRRPHPTPPRASTGERGISLPASGPRVGHVENRCRLAQAHHREGVGTDASGKARVLHRQVEIGLQPRLQAAETCSTERGEGVPAVRSVEARSDARPRVRVRDLDHARVGLAIWRCRCPTPRAAGRRRHSVRPHSRAGGSGGSSAWPRRGSRGGAAR